MPKFLTSLQFRLIIGFAVILALAMSSVSVYARYSAARELNAFVEEITAIREERLEEMASEMLASGRRGERLAELVEQAGELYGLRIAVADQNGIVIGRTQIAPNYAFFGESIELREGRIGVNPREPNRDRPGRRAALLRLISDDIDIGTLAFTDAGSEAFVRQEPRAAVFIDSVDNFLLWSGIAAGAAAIAVSMFVSRRTLSPLRLLQAAAERLGTGDLSQRVAITRHDEIGEMAQTFNAMAEGLEQAEAQRRVLMADVAHELRTPLANIQGYVEAIRDDVIEADESTIDTLHQQVLHLAHLIEDLRLMALAEAGALRLDPQPASIGDTARRAVEAIRPRADAKHIALTVDAPTDMPLASFDQERIGQVIANLLENAVRHTPESGAVSVSAETMQSTVRVTIQDTGSGIPGDEIGHIFDRFHRVDPSRTRATGGAGLGLTVAKQLIEAHGGTIAATSVVGEGSTFTFDLPLKPQ